MVPGSGRRSGAPGCGLAQGDRHVVSIGHGCGLADASKGSPHSPLCGRSSFGGGLHLRPPGWSAPSSRGCAGDNRGGPGHIPDMQAIPLSEFKAACTALLKGIASTKEPFVITFRGKPLAIVSPVPCHEDRILGGQQGACVPAEGDWSSLLESSMGEDWS
jgi:hypothetical protein